MITTGWPAIKRLATCGSEPSEFSPPFGGEQGTRLKISPADLATCFTLSTAFAVSVLGGRICSGEGSTRLGVAAVGCAPGADAAWESCDRESCVGAAGVSAACVVTCACAARAVSDSARSGRIGRAKLRERRRELQNVINQKP